MDVSNTSGHVTLGSIISESFLNLNQGDQDIKKAKNVVFEPHRAPVSTKLVQDVVLPLPVGKIFKKWPTLAPISFL